MYAARARAGAGARVKRTPELTREGLLRSAFREVYRSGFQSASLDAILAGAGVTKGALYHHFDTKEALGYAVVEEVIAGITREKWLRPLENAANPLDALIGVVESSSMSLESLCGGCPLNNLATEMSPLDEGFRTRLARVFNDWQSGMAAALRAGQKRGLVRKDLDADDASTWLMAMYEGYISLAKNSQDPRVLESGKRSVVRCLESLRAPQGGRAARSR